MRSLARRLLALEAQYHRRAAARVAPPGRVDELIELMIRHLERPLAEQRAHMPNVTDAERREMQSWLPALRRARRACPR